MPTQTFFNLPDTKRERFLEIAINEFADHSYKSASISRICKEAGIAKGSFYQYFEDKKELFHYLITLSLEEKRALIAQLPIPDEQAGLFAYLRWSFRLQARFDLQHPRLAEVGYRALYDDLPFRDELVARLRQASYEGYGDLLDRGIADGSVRPDIDREAGTWLMVTLFGELGRYIKERLGLADIQMFTRELSDEEWAQANLFFDGILEILERGLGNRVAGGPESELEAA